MERISQVLDEKAILVCQRLGGSDLMTDYYLAGGTALALQMGHRRSLDLDFFQNNNAERIVWARISRELTRLFGEKAKPTLRQSTQSIWELMDTKVTFLAYPFPLLYPLIKGEEISPALKGLSLADPREIASMKAYALGRRATFRDYLDLYFLLRFDLVSLRGLIQDARRKFIVAGETVFSPKLFLEQLTYLEDIEDKGTTLNLLVEPTLSPEEIQEYLRQEVAAFLEQQT